MINNALHSAKNDSFYSRDNYQVDFQGPRWVLSKDVTVPVVMLESVLSEKGFEIFKRVLSYFAKSHSPSHVLNMFNRCSAYLQMATNEKPFSVPSLISYYSTLNSKTQWYMGVIRTFIRQWHRLGYEGVSDDVIRLLDKWVIKGNEKGFAVQTMCPDKGPLTDIEMGGVVSACIEGLTSERLTLEEVSCALLFAMTGRRPIQIAALRIKDLREVSAGQYRINFPRAKQRGQGWRSEFNQFAIVEDLWLVLRRLASEVELGFEHRLGVKVPERLIGELPLFPAFRGVSPEIDLEEMLDGDYLHAPTEKLKSIMIRIGGILEVISERTGAPVALNANRFRYTLGTNLAREGKGVYVIAEALDHSDIQNAGVYVKNLPDIVERIDKAVALQLAPYAQAFRGVIVRSETEAQRGEDPASRISTGRDNVGTCGSYGFCGALAPIACYTCTHFQPWIDGPHEEVLEGLILERDRFRAISGDMKIASANDRLILAVSDVVIRCKSAREKKSRG